MTSETSLLVHAIAGATSSALALGLLYPLDQLRTFLQLGVDDYENVNWWKVLYDNTSLALTEPLSLKPKFEPLYRGMTPSLITIAVSNFLFFWTYQGIRSVANRKLGEKAKRFATAVNLVSSAIAGVLNVLLTNPLWVVSMRLKVESSHPFHFFSYLLHIYQTEGCGALWNGTVPSLMLVSNPIIQFTVYESMKSLLLETRKKEALSGSQGFFLGALAKAAATIATYPLQVAQSRMRAEECGEDALQCLAQMYESEGMSGLFQGLDAKLLQTVLTASVIFASYETILGWLDVPKQTGRKKLD